MKKEEWQNKLAHYVLEMVQLIDINGAPNLGEYRLAREMIAYLEWEGWISSRKAAVMQDELKEEYLRVG